MNRVTQIFSNHRKLPEVLANTLFILISVLILLYPAIENGYPILHSDSGSYLIRGFTGEVPLDRPITYALFVRHTSLWYSVWLVVIAQALLLVLLIHQVLKVAFGFQLSGVLTLIIVAILAHTTGVGHYVSQIMADIFLSFILLSTLLLLTARRLSITGAVILVILIVFSNGTHLSNIPVFTSAIVLSIFLLLLFKIKLNRKRLIPVAVALLLSWVFVPTLNLFYGSGFSFTRVGYVIQFARLLETGVARDFIKNKCEREPDFALCKYADDIDRYDRLDKFLWNNDSFLYDHPANDRGWDTCWIERNDEFKAYIKEIRAEPGFINYWFNQAITGFGQQFINFKTKHFDPMGEGSHIRWIIDGYFKVDYKQYLGARQQAKALFYNIQNKIQFFTVIISVAIILVFLFISRLRKNSFDTLTSTMLILFTSAYLASAAVVAVFGTVSGRFQGRIVWLLPMIVLWLIANYVKHTAKLSETNSIKEPTEDTAR